MPSGLSASGVLSCSGAALPPDGAASGPAEGFLGVCQDGRGGGATAGRSAAEGAGLESGAEPDDLFLINLLLGLGGVLGKGGGGGLSVEEDEALAAGAGLPESDSFLPLVESVALADATGDKDAGGVEPLGEVTGGDASGGEEADRRLASLSKKCDEE